MEKAFSEKIIIPKDGQTPDSRYTMHIEHARFEIEKRARRHGTKRYISSLYFHIYAEKNGIKSSIFEIPAVDI